MNVQHQQMIDTIDEVAYKFIIPHRYRNFHRPNLLPQQCTSPKVHLYLQVNNFFRINNFVCFWFFSFLFFALYFLFLHFTHILLTQSFIFSALLFCHYSPFVIFSKKWNCNLKRNFFHSFEVYFACFILKKI